MRKDVEIQISAKLDDIDRQFSKVSSLAQAAAQKVNSAFTGINLSGIFAGISAGAFAAMVKDVAELGDGLAKMSVKTGVAVEELSKLQYAASLSDVSNDDLANSLGRLNRILGEAADGSKEATDALARFGIAPGALNASEAFNQIADRVKNTSDQTKIASAMNDIFGRSWQTLMPLVKGGSDNIKSAGNELERMGGVMSGKLAESSEKFNDNLTKIGKSLASLKVQSLGPVVEGLAELTDKFTEATKAGGGFFAGLRIWSQTSGNAEGNPGESIGRLVRELKALEEQQSAIINGSDLGFSEDQLTSTYRQISLITSQIEYLKNLNNRATADGYQDRWLGNVTGTGIKGKPSGNGKPPKTKEEKFDLSQYDAMVKAEEHYLQALRTIADAQESARRSTLGLSDAQEKLLDLQQSGTWATLSAEQKAVAESQAKFADEAIRAADAQSRLNALIDSLPSSQIEKSWETMELLNKAVEAGTITQAKYSEAVNKLFDGGAEKIEKNKSLAQELGLSFTSAFEDAIVKGNEFSDVLEGLAQDILRIMVRKNITEPLTSSLGSLELSKLFTENANGNVYASPSLSAFSGGVYDSPQFFKFAKGAGVFAEAGAEAIMPLTRGPNGKLGVNAQGAGGNVQVIVNNNAPNTQATQRSRADGNGGSIIEVVIEQITGRISSDIARGSGTVPTALEQTYGLNRAAGL